MTLSLSKKGVKLQKHNQYRHAGPRSPEKGQAASPASINGWRSRIRCGMTPFLHYYISKFNVFYRIYVNKPKQEIL